MFAFIALILTRLAWAMDENDPATSIQDINTVFVSFDPESRTYSIVGTIEDEVGYYEYAYAEIDVDSTPIAECWYCEAPVYTYDVEENHGRSNACCQHYDL
jgi:hypothetical protein